MQKKLIALAVAAAFSAPAFADNANVTLYGKAILDYEHVVNDKHANNPSSVNRVQSNASRFGIKGSEDVGGDIKAFYQFEVEMDADGDGLSGSSTTTTGTTATTTTGGVGAATTTKTGGFAKTRNSGVGLEGAFGKVIYGIWDTPYKVSRNAIELFDNTTVFSATNLIGRSNGNNFNTRKNSALAYVSPAIGPVTLSAAYSPDESAKSGANKHVASFAATLNMAEQGIYVALAHEVRNDNSVTTTKDSASRLVGKFTLGDLWIGATIERIKINTSTTANYTQSNNEVAAQYKLGANNIGLSYVKAGKKDVASTGASQVSLRYGYNFSKRTELFAAYTSLKNDAIDAAVANSGGTYGFSAGSTFGTDKGSKQTAIGLGLIHSF